MGLDHQPVSGLSLGRARQHVPSFFDEHKTALKGLVWTNGLEGAFEMCQAHFLFRHLPVGRAFNSLLDVTQFSSGGIDGMRAGVLQRVAVCMQGLLVVSNQCWGLNAQKPLQVLHFDPVSVDDLFARCFNGLPVMFKFRLAAAEPIGGGSVQGFAQLDQVIGGPFKPLQHADRYLRWGFPRGMGDEVGDNEVRLVTDPSPYGNRRLGYR